MYNFIEHFPLEQNIQYLNHAAVSPWPKCTANAVTNFAHENLTKGASQYLKWLDVEQSLRERLAQLLNIESSQEIALAKSTSEALSIIAYGIDWKEGDEVVISDQEFPSNRIVWESLQPYGVKVITATITPDDSISSIERCISPRTKLVSISSVQYATGQAIHLKKLSQLCQKNNTLLCVDAIQSLGVLPFDQTAINADFIVADGHKWMMSAEGLALMFIKKEHHKKLKLHQFGWRMIKNKGKYDELEWQPADDATRFECGSPNMLGIHALNASIGLILEIGMTTIHQELIKRVSYLIQQLQTIEGIEFISDISEEKLSGIVCFRVPSPNLESLYQDLMRQGVICAYRGGGIRFSPHFYTPFSTIDNAINTLKKLI